MIDLSFGEYIRSLRIKKGLSLRKAAAKIGIAFTYLADIEKGKRQSPPRHYLKTIIYTYTIPTDDFRHFYDLACECTKQYSVPDDVLQILEQDKHIINMIRNMKGI